MANIIFLDKWHEEIEIAYFNPTQNDQTNFVEALKIIDQVTAFNVGKERETAEKMGYLCVDFNNLEIKVKVNYEESDEDDE